MPIWLLWPWLWFWLSALVLGVCVYGVWRKCRHFGVSRLFRRYHIQAFLSLAALPFLGQVLLVLAHRGGPGSWLSPALTGVLFAFCVYGSRKITRSSHALELLEGRIYVFLRFSTWLAVLTTVGIIAALVVETYRFFQLVPLADFLFGLHWSPQSAGQGGEAARGFGVLPVLWGTLLISFIALFFAVPIGLLSAVYLHEYASGRVRAVLKPALELLAGVPTIVYGFFAAILVGPFLRDTGSFLGVSISTESALAAGGIMSLMLIPFISSLQDDALRAVPRQLRDSSLAIGATRSETVRFILLPASFAGLMGAILLGASRAIGETMIVVMAAGLEANLTGNPFEAVTTTTVQIVSLLTGDQAFDSPKTLAAFALGSVLFCMTLFFNFLALYWNRKYKKKHDA